MGERPDCTAGLVFASEVLARRLALNEQAADLPTDAHRAERSTTLVSEEPANSVCAVCGATAAYPVLEAPAFDDPSASCILLECSGCHAVRTWPPVSPSSLSALYSEEYYGGNETKFIGTIEIALANLTARRASWLDRRWRMSCDNRCVETPRALDIGCGRGTMLKALHAKGWECWGVERQDYSGGASPEFALFRGDLRDLPAPKGYFNLVILWHSLEHLPCPRGVIERAAELLTDRGLIAVAVPNYGSLQRLLFGSSWFALDVPRHRYHFRKCVLHRLFNPYFRIETESTWSADQNAYAFVQSTLNMLGGHMAPNRLYAALHAGPDRRRDWPSLGIQTMIGTLAIVPALIEYAASGVLGTGATLTVTARKVEQ